MGMYTPYAYTTDKADFNEDLMLKVITPTNEKYCNHCEMGAAGNKVGYLSPGTSLDYMYDEMNVEYSFVFEIYSGNPEFYGSMLELPKIKYVSPNAAPINKNFLVQKEEGMSLV